MDFLFSIKEPALIFLTLTAYFLAFAQTLHVMLIRRSERVRKVQGGLAYEALLILHLLLACFTANSAHFNFGRILFKMRMISLDIEPLMWANAIIFSLGVFLGIRQRKAIMAPELCILALSTPPAVSMSGRYSWFLLFLDIAFFLFRVSASVSLDLNRARNNITTLSIAEALKKMPEGVYLATKRRILFMNDAMRDELVNLGVGGHLKENVKLWDKISALAKNASRKSWQPCFVDASNGRMLMFSRDERMCGKRMAEQIVSVDVTEVHELNEKINATNEELLRANVRLSEELKNLEESAQQEAAFQMHKRVHDEIGQRLSILHQWLEGTNVEDVTQAQIVELTHDITSSLRTKHVEPEDELASLIDAFSQAGVTITINGDESFKLGAPLKPKTYNLKPTTTTYNLKPNLLLEIVREASTNALKHGAAKNVWVNIEEEKNVQTITISNDGNGAKTMPELGSGLRAMKKRIESEGGRFKISATEPFTIVATFENEGNRQND